MLLLLVLLLLAILCGCSALDLQRAKSLLLTTAEIQAFWQEARRQETPTPTFPLQFQSIVDVEVYDKTSENVLVFWGPMYQDGSLNRFNQRIGTPDGVYLSTQAVITDTAASSETILYQSGDAINCDVFPNSPAAPADYVYYRTVATEAYIVDTFVSGSNNQTAVYYQDAFTKVPYVLSIDSTAFTQTTYKPGPIDPSFFAVPAHITCTDNSDINTTTYPTIPSIVLPFQY